MWSYQHAFRTSIYSSTKRALSDIGFECEPEVLLVGFDTSNTKKYATCVEPEKGPYGDVDLSDVNRRGFEIYQNNPLSSWMNTNARLHQQQQDSLLDQSRGVAIANILEESDAGRGRRFFCSTSVKVDTYAVHTVIGVEKSLLKAIPTLRERVIEERWPIVPSLVHAVIQEILFRSAKALYIPDAGEHFNVLGADSHEINRSATTTAIRSVLRCAGRIYEECDLTVLSDISALPYERRWARGRIVFAPTDIPAVDVTLQLLEPIPLSNVHAIRKLMEASGIDGSLLSDGNFVTGYGRINTGKEEPRESIFTMFLRERGSWDLRHRQRSLFTVRDGVGKLTTSPLNTTLFRDVVSRRIEGADTEALIRLAHSLRHNEHGAMLVISSDAASESARLSPQAMGVSPAPLDRELAKQLTNMDGGILVDGSGNCHAIGVILDGVASGHGIASRGSRYNNAVRYLTRNPPPAVVVVYSTDGTIDIMPDLRPQVDRREVFEAIQNYVAAASATEPV